MYSNKTSEITKMKLNLFYINSNSFVCLELSVSISLVVLFTYIQGFFSAVEFLEAVPVQLSPTLLSSHFQGVLFLHRVHCFLPMLAFCLLSVL